MSLVGFQAEICHAEGDSAGQTTPQALAHAASAGGRLEAAIRSKIQRWNRDSQTGFASEEIQIRSRAKKITFTSFARENLRARSSFVFVSAHFIFVCNLL